MKVLWFTNTPCSSAEKLSLGINSGGWLSSLEMAVSENVDIELHVAFFHHNKIEPYVHNNMHFYPIFGAMVIQRLEGFLSAYLN